MRDVLISALVLLALLGAGLALWCESDRRAGRRAMAGLLARRAEPGGVYSPALVADQPAQVQRYFNAMLRPGAVLNRTVQLRMTGRLRLGDRTVTFAGAQVLSLDHGFVWAMRSCGGMPVAGADADDWTRFWLARLIPVARAGGTGDHRRSAFGRRVIEAVVWSPAALLPGPGVVWRAADGPDAPLTVSVTRDGLNQTVTVTLGPDGRPTRVAMQRWSDQTPDGRFALVPFGGRISGYLWAPGQAVASPVAVAYGDAAPFFEAQITSADFDGPPRLDGPRCP